MLNKVPDVTICFWLIKVLCTTVGETFADNVNEKLKLGLPNTTYIMGALLVISPIGDFPLSRGAGGLGLGTVVTSVIFLGAILAPVIYLTVTHRDEIPAAAADEREQRVVVGVNLTPESTVALKWASRGASCREVELVVTPNTAVRSTRC